MTVFRHPQVEDEYQRWLAKLPQVQSFPKLSYADVLSAHFVLVDMFYGEKAGLGGIGPKSLDLLISAVERQNVSFGGIDKWERPEEIAATLLYGIVLNHPFHDANKRTGFLSTIWFLNRNDLTLKISEQKFEDFTVHVAEKSFRNMEKYKRSFEGQDDADVKYIAHYLRSVTRQIVKKDFTITYRELSSILRRFGFDFQNPHRNTIDVVEVATGKRVCNIGYHSMTKQVSKGTLKYVRQETDLDLVSGCDSGVFFDGEEPLHNLLARYYEPLERLAFR